MIRSYGRSVATNLNEPMFGESRAAPLQGAEIGRPSRSELERVPNDDILPTDHSTMKSDRYGRDYRRPEQDEDPVLRQYVYVGNLRQRRKNRIVKKLMMGDNRRKSSVEKL